MKTSRSSNFTVPYACLGVIVPRRCGPAVLERTCYEPAFKLVKGNTRNAMYCMEKGKT